MAKKNLALLLCLLLAVVASAAVNYHHPDPSVSHEASVGPIEPPGGLDLVTWTQGANALYTFGRAGTAVLGNYLYCFGSEGLNVAQAFNLTTEQWENSTPPPYGYDNWPAIATLDHIYLIGRSSLSVVGSEVQRFTPNGSGPTGTWTLMSHYPQEAYGVCAAWDGGNYIYAAGGFTSSTALTAASRYKISGDWWETITDLPVAMGFAGAAFGSDGKFHVMGGNDTGNAHYAYDSTSGEWSTKAAVPTAIYFATSSVTSNESFILSVGGGGGYYIWPAINTVQIYNPATDSWSQDQPLPVARGCNSAAWVGNGTVISAGGFLSGWSNVTYKGIGFPGGPPHDVEITVTPVAPPIIIPPAGGSFNFNVSVHNNETGAVNFDAWCMVQLPSSSWYGPVLGPVNLTLSGGVTLTRLRTQNVPASAPAGAYTYRGYVGNYALVKWDSSSFTFTKAGSRIQDSGFGGWSNTGEEFDVGARHAVPASGSGPEGGLRSATPTRVITPNPFNPTATISFELRASSFVNLSVYDISGRSVATLVDGLREAGEHQVIFDGSGLAAGVYLYRLQAGEVAVSGKMVLMK